MSKLQQSIQDRRLFLEKIKKDKEPAQLVIEDKGKKAIQYFFENLVRSLPQ